MSLLIALALAAAGPSKEELKLLGPVKDTPIVQLDPNGAYILLRSPAPVPINLFRIATADEMADYQRRRAEALAKAHRKWEGRHADWLQASQSKDPQARGLAGDEPVEPTDANLAFSPIDQENLLAFGPLFRFSKDKDGSSTYLQRVWPGRYVVYGSIFVNPNGGGTGFCVCMGTIAFDAKAGEITDVGTVTTSLDPLTFPRVLEKAKPEDVEGLQSGTITMMRWKVYDTSMAVDPRLSAFKIVPASFRSAGPVPNYFGVQVDRMTAIPGVLAYDRDKIVDVAPSAAAGR
jgi:hypothetical protein